MLGLILTLALAGADGNTPPASFCARAAPELDLKPKGSPADGVWEARVLNLAQRFLIGGTASVGISLQIQAATQEELDARTAHCGPSAKGLFCAVSGPGVVKMTLKDRKIDLRAEPGEKAEVSVEGTLLRCKDL